MFYPINDKSRSKND